MEMPKWVTELMEPDGDLRTTEYEERAASRYMKTLSREPRF